MKSSVCLLFCCICCWLSPHAQVYENDAGRREKLFIYEVKQLDEFFERFNDEPNSFIRKIYAEKKTKFNIKRQDLIRSLFNYENKIFKPGAIDSFVTVAMNYRMPNSQNFYGKDWYAEALCDFEYNGVAINIPVVLVINTDENHRSKWMILAANPPPLKQTTTLQFKRSGYNSSKFISASSHETAFIELERILKDKSAFSDYTESGFSQNDRSLQFYSAVVQNQLKFKTVKKIKYHFLQVENYIFTVERFTRNTLNAGWLINSLKTATVDQKEAYLKNNLGI